MICGRFGGNQNGSAHPTIPKHHCARGRRARQDQFARPAGRPAQLCALVQIRLRRQRAPVCGGQHPPRPQRYADPQRYRRTAWRPHRPRPRPGQDRPHRPADGWRDRSDPRDGRGRGGHRRPFYAGPRERRAAAGPHGRSCRRSRHHRCPGAGHARRCGKERAAAGPAPGDVGRDRAAPPRDDRPAHGKPDRSP